MSLNKVILMGRLTVDPEHKQTPNGVSVTSFTIAVDRNFSSKNGERQTDFINIVAWRQTADFVCNYFAKGGMIALEGSLQSRRYVDKQGNNRIAYEVVADQVYFAGSKQKDSSAPPSSHPQADDFEEVDAGSDDLPF